MLVNGGTNAPNIALPRRQPPDGPEQGRLRPAVQRVPTVIAASGAWHHLVVTRSAAGAGNTKIYLDGVAETVTAVSPATTLANNSEVLTFGRKNVGPIERWGGKLDEIAIYRRVLSAAEVVQPTTARG